MFTLIGS